MILWLRIVPRRTFVRRLDNILRKSSAESTRGSRNNDQHQTLLRLLYPDGHTKQTTAGNFYVKPFYYHF